MTSDFKPLTLLCAIRDRDDLDIEEQSILSAIVLRMNPNRKDWPDHVKRVAGDAEAVSWQGYAKLAADARVSVRTAKARVKRLEDLGVLVVLRSRIPGSNESDGNVYMVKVVHGVHHVVHQTHDVVRAAHDGGAPDAQHVVHGVHDGGARRAPKLSTELSNGTDQEEEGAAPPPAAADLELGEEQALDLADQVAREHGKPRPQRGHKSIDAIRELMADAQTAAARCRWTNPEECLRLRLEAHYQRDDAFLQEHGYSITLARQVAQATPERPRPPVAPEKPDDLSPPKTEEEIQAAVAMWKSSPPMMRDIADKFREYAANFSETQKDHAVKVKAYESAMAAYLPKLAAWRQLVGRPPIARLAMPQMNGGAHAAEG